MTVLKKLNDFCNQFNKNNNKIFFVVTYICMKVKVKELKENSMNKIIQEMYEDIIEFKVYQPHLYLIKKCTIVADTTSLLSRSKQLYSNLINVHQSKSFEGSEIYTAEPETPAPSFLEVEIAIENLKT